FGPMKTCGLACLAALVVMTAPAVAQKADVAGSSDHPLVGRYDGAVITSYPTKGYEELSLPTKGLERAGRDNPSAWQTELAGKLTSIRYEGPGSRSILEIMRNHEAALKAKGFTIRFFCRGQEQCSPGRMIPTFW